MDFRLANYEDIDKICSSLKEIIKNKHKGLNWTEDYPNGEVFKEDIKNKELYLLINHNNLIGGVTLNKDQDKSYNSVKWEEQGDALLIHRLFISNEFKGRGYGKLLMDKCIEFAEENNFKSIRLDTFNENVMAQKLYTSKGFKYRGRVKLRGKEGIFYCYELKINNK